MQARKELSKEMPVKQVLASHKTAVVIGMLLTWFLTACVVVLNFSHAKLTDRCLWF